MRTLHEIKTIGEPPSYTLVEASTKNMPMVLVLKRKAFRQFPSGQFVALYHSDKLGIDISIPYSPNKKDREVAGITTEEVLKESEHDELFGDYTESLKKHFESGSVHTDHPELLKLKAKVISKYGKDAHRHLHAAAEHYLNGDVAKAARNYSKFEHKINEEFYEGVIEAEFEELEEAAIHKLHQIVKTKTDGEVVFGNGSKHKLSFAQAAHVMKMHTLATPENKATIEKHLGTPEGLKKVCDFAAEHLK